MHHDDPDLFALPISCKLFFLKIYYIHVQVHDMFYIRKQFTFRTGPLLTLECLFCVVVGM